MSDVGGPSSPDASTPTAAVPTAAVPTAAVPTPAVPTPTGPVPAVPLTAPPLDGPHGAPVLVLGNSLGTSAAVWDRQVGRFREHFRLLRFELPGHAGSPAPPGPYSVGGLGAGVLALLDSRGVDRVAYCGISLGGMIGIWLAAHAPDRIAALGLVCTSAYLPPASGWLARGRPGARGRHGVGRRPGHEPVVHAGVRCAGSRRRRRVPRRVRAHRSATATRAAARPSPRWTSGPTWLPSQRRRWSWRARTIAATPPEHAEVIARGIPGARLEVIPDAAHLAPVSAPARVTAALLAHIRAAAL